MKPIKINNTALHTYFEEDGIRLGNYFLWHESWRNFKTFDEIRELELPRLAIKDFSNNIELFKKLYRENIK